MFRLVAPQHGRMTVRLDLDPGVYGIGHDIFDGSLRRLGDVAGAISIDGPDLTIAVTVGQTYYVRVRGVGTGGYTLSLSTEGREDDDYGDSFAELRTRSSWTLREGRNRRGT